jgi:hypothetical protein
LSGTGPGRNPPAGIPTLTEVVTWPEQAPIAPAPAPGSAPSPVPAPAAAPTVVAVPVAAAAAAATPVVVPPVAASIPAPAVPAAPIPAPTAAVAAPAMPVTAPAAPINEAQLVQRILVDLQRQIDLMLEVRLREALAPVLARATDALIRDARKELTTALRDAVARSVAQELARRQDR